MRKDTEKQPEPEEAKEVQVLVTHEEVVRQLFNNIMHEIALIRQDVDLIKKKLGTDVQAA